MTRELEKTSFLSGGNSAFIEGLYARYVSDAKSVDPSWQHFFAELGDAAAVVEAEARGASWTPARYAIAEEHLAEASEALGDGEATALTPITSEDERLSRTDSIRALMLIRAYRVRGHLIADLDPLGLERPGASPRARSRDLWFHRSR